MRNQNSKLSEARGFTMIELLVTVVIAGVISALAVPNFQAAYDRQTFKSGHRDMVSALQEARSSAISNNSSYGVYFDSDGMTITLFENSSNPSVASYDDGDQTVSVDTLSHVFEYLHTDAANSAIVFQPNGSAQLSSYGNVYMTGEMDGMMAYFSTNVLASTGRIASYSHFYDW